LTVPLQLPVQVLEIAEGARQEEVLADVAEGPLDLALGFGPVRPAGFGMEAEVPGQIDERAVVDNAARRRHSAIFINKRLFVFGGYAPYRGAIGRHEWMTRRVATSNAQKCPWKG
jgi:hypothetical protein